MHVHNMAEMQVTCTLTPWTEQQQLRLFPLYFTESRRQGQYTMWKKPALLTVAKFHQKCE